MKSNHRWNLTHGGVLEMPSSRHADSHNQLRRPLLGMPELFRPHLEHWHPERLRKALPARDAS